MSKRAKEAALKAYPKDLVACYFDDPDKMVTDDNEEARAYFQEGYELAEKDILSKITPEHIAGLKWIGNAGISSQPYPYHKYCKDLLKTLEELLNNE